MSREVCQQIVNHQGQDIPGFYFFVQGIQRIQMAADLRAESTLSMSAPS